MMVKQEPSSHHHHSAAHVAALRAPSLYQMVSVTAEPTLSITTHYYSERQCTAYIHDLTDRCPPQPVFDDDHRRLHLGLDY